MSYHPLVFENAAVGRVMLISANDPIPVNWRECDGATLSSRDWPLFVHELGVKGSTFTVPQPQRTLDGYRFIVKMGQEPSPEPTPEEIESRQEREHGLSPLSPRSLSRQRAEIERGEGVPE